MGSPIDASKSASSPAPRKRATLYSRSAGAAPGASGAAPRVTVATAAIRAHEPAASMPPAATPPKPRQRAARITLTRRQAALGVLASLLLAATLGALVAGPWRSTGRVYTQADIDAAVLHTLETKNLPSRAARAAATVMPSIVLVRGSPAEPKKPAEMATDPKGEAPSKPGAPEPAKPGRAVGTGVVIADDGTVLTSWHVVAGAEKIVLTFHDRSESEAVVVSVRADKDLAVLKPRRVPDDLQPATLRTTAGVAPGDEVIAVGFPFGIGPSVSAGVVSGLGREHRVGSRADAQGNERGGLVLTNLIQFDAAANPGNSGGPLVTMDGQVVGIVCSILNPTDQAVFIGIGMAVPIEDAAQAAGMPPA